MTAALATDAIDFAIRPARSDEMRWVQSVWSRCAKLNPRKPWSLTPCGGPDANVMESDPRRYPLWLTPEMLYRMHHRLVDELLPKCSVLVAALRRLPDDGIGFAVFETSKRVRNRTGADHVPIGTVLHYVYVAPDSRRAGIGRQLALHTRCSTASHVTPDGARLLRCLSGYAS